MRTLLSHTLCGLMLLGSLALPACKTDEPGVKSNYYSQFSTMPGDTTKVTAAAKEVLEDLKLQGVESSSTALDGWAKATTADKTKIDVKVAKEGPNTSKVTVNVGALGDPAMGKDIITRIQKKVGG